MVGAEKDMCVRASAIRDTAVGLHDFGGHACTHCANAAAETLSKTPRDMKVSAILAHTSAPRARPRSIGGIGSTDPEEDGAALTGEAGVEAFLLSFSLESFTRAAARSAKRRLTSGPSSRDKLKGSILRWIPATIDNDNDNDNDKDSEGNETATASGGVDARGGEEEEEEEEVEGRSCCQATDATQMRNIPTYAGRGSDVVWETLPRCPAENV